MGILFYAVESIGVGHLSRMLGIAEAIRQIQPELPILFITEANDARLLEEHGFPYYQLPASHAFGNKRWRTARQAGEQAFNQILGAILIAHKPILIVHDTTIQPQLYKLAVERGIAQALIMRERRDLLTYLAQHRAELDTFKLIAFPHQPEELPDLSVLRQPEDKLIFCGPILRRTISDLQVDEIREQYGLKPDELTIVVTNGGGNAMRYFDDDFMSIVLNAIQSIEVKLPPLRVIAVTGPLSRRRIPWVDLAKGKMIIREFEPRLFDLFAAANLVIARGGYNTVLELEQLGVPAICIPARRGVESQEQRIRRAADAGKQIRLGELDVNALGREIRQIAGGPLWRYELSGKLDGIAANKISLARRLSEVALDTPTTLVA